MSAVATNPEIMVAPTYTGNAPKAVFLPVSSIRIFSRSARNAKTPQSKGGTCAKTSGSTIRIETDDQNDL